jgi:hypothetical protein
MRDHSAGSLSTMRGPFEDSPVIRACLRGPPPADGSTSVNGVYPSSMPPPESGRRLVGWQTKVQDPLSQASQRLRWRPPSWCYSNQLGRPAIRILDTGCLKASARAVLWPPRRSAKTKGSRGRAHVGKVRARRRIGFCSTTFGRASTNCCWSQRPTTVHAGR